MKRDNSYIRLWRQTEQSAVWAAGDGVWRLWCCLLMRATHKPRKAVIPLGRHSVVIDLLPGQYVIRQTRLADDLSIDAKTLRRRLEVLQECECVTVEPTRRNLHLVTIRNWQKYQSDTPGKLPEVSPEVSASRQLSSHKNKKKSASLSSDDARFDAWWGIYPRRVGKKQAHKAFAAALREVDFETLMAATHAFAASDKARGDFCPHPTTWLNQGRWDDDPATWQDHGGNGQQVSSTPAPLKKAKDLRT